MKQSYVKCESKHDALILTKSSMMNSYYLYFMLRQSYMNARKHKVVLVLPDRNEIMKNKNIFCYNISLSLTLAYISECQR